MFRILDVFKFIRQYPVMDEWSDVQLILKIETAIKQGLFAYSFNAENQLNGICIAEVPSDSEERHENCLHIILLCGIKGTYKTMIAHLKKNFPEVSKLTYYRKKKSKYLTLNVK